MKLVAAIIAGFFIALGFLLIGQSFNFHPTEPAYISITFDDGYVSQYEAAEILESYGFRATFYVPSSLLGGEFEGLPIMTEQQVLDLQEKGYEIGSHTKTHANASNVTEEEYAKEVLESKTVAGFRTENFAYPYGDNKYKEIVCSEFKSARTVSGEINNLSNLSKCELSGLSLFHKDEQYLVLEKYLGNLKQNGGWLIINIHNIDENPRPDTDLTEEELKWILNSIKASGIEVKTVNEVLDAA